MSEDHRVGTIGWADLTVKPCEQVRDFYQAVVGWTASGVDMGEYEDYGMIPPGMTEPVAGICHAMGINESMPAQWLVYIRVADVPASIKRCTELGGKVLAEPRDFGSYGWIAVIQDPAGAVCAIQSPPAAT